MKALQLVIFAGLCLFTINTLKAQVKIGDAPLTIGDDRWLEIQRDGVSEFLIVTDSLYFGRSNSPNTNTPADALMLKLYGYGLNNFVPSAAGEQQSTALGNVFLAPSTNGEVLEVPMSLSLVIADSTVADLSITNGLDTFGRVNLMELDSIFATDNDLRDSISTVRTLINQSNTADRDTITGNEYIDEINVLGDTAIEFVENILGRLGDVNRDTVDLSGILGANTFYLSDGSFDEDRTVDGATFNLDFNNVDTFGVQANDFVQIDGNEVSIQQGGQDVIMINSDQDVKIRSSIDSILYANGTNGSISLGEYGEGNFDTSDFASILVVGADGQILETTPEDILGTQEDSTIYTHDGTLTGDRILNGTNLYDLNFDSLSTFAVRGTATFDMNATNVEMDGTNYTANYTTSTISTDAGDNTIQSTLGDIVVSAADTLDMEGALVTVDATSTIELTSTGNTEIAADSLIVSEELKLEGYGDSLITGTFVTFLAVDDDGDVIEVTADQILGTETDSVIYRHDGTLSSDRTLTGAGNSLTFTGVDSMTLSGVNTTIASTGVLDVDAPTVDIDGTTYTGDFDDITSTAVDSNVVAGATTVIGGTTAVDINGGTVTVDGSTIELTSTGNTEITADSLIVSEELKLEGYGDSLITGTFVTFLAVDDDGDVIEVTADQILGTETDSVIYRHDGTLSSDRTLTGAGNSLTFTGVDSMTLSGVNTTIASTGVLDVDAPTVDINGTTYTGDFADIISTATDSNIISGTTAVDIDGGNITLDATGTTTLTSVGNTNINADSLIVSQEFKLDAYGDSTYLSSDFVTFLAVDDIGNVIEVTADQILGTETDSVIYRHNGTLSSDRTLTGAGNSLTFTGVDSMTLSGVNTTITSTGTLDVDAPIVDIDGTTYTGDFADIISTATDSNIISGTTAVDIDGGSVTIDATGTTILTSTGNTDINADSLIVSEELKLEGYGDSLITGTFVTFLAVDDVGNVIEVTADQILGTETDSVIYRHDGTLTGQRFMTMDGNDLHFVGATDTTIIHDDASISIGGPTVRQNAGSTVMLDVYGDIYAVQVHSSSDRRFKKNITPIKNAIGKVQSLNGVTYDFRTEEFADRNFTSEHQVGFIAQDVEKVLPEVVATDQDGYKSVDYAKITALLNEAIKEQQEEIETLRSQLSISQANNTEMKSELADIKDMLKVLMKTNQNSRKLSE